MNDFNFLKDHRSVFVKSILTNVCTDRNTIDFEPLEKPILGLYKTQKETYNCSVEQTRSSCFF